jgi:hypothetical protein
VITGDVDSAPRAYVVRPLRVGGVIVPTVASPPAGHMSCRVRGGPTVCIHLWPGSTSKRTQFQQERCPKDSGALKLEEPHNVHMNCHREGEGGNCIDRTDPPSKVRRYRFENGRQGTSGLGLLPPLRGLEMY